MTNFSGSGRAGCGAYAGISTFDLPVRWQESMAT